jgi:hypothetical protein
MSNHANPAAARAEREAEAIAHARRVLSYQENRLTPHVGICTPLDRVRAMVARLDRLIFRAEGSPLQVYWHSKWLSYAQACACLKILEQRETELAGAGAAA